MPDETASESPPTDHKPAGARAPQRSRRRLALWGGGLLALGAGLEATAVAVWGTDRWPEVLVSVGAGVLLAGFVMLIEPRLARDVGRAAGAASADLAATTATDVATRVAEDRTRGLEERISRVESAGDIQNRVHTRLDDEAAGRASRVRSEPTFRNVADILHDADSRSLFRGLWVKCGTRESFLLQFGYGTVHPAAAPSYTSVFVSLGNVGVRPQSLHPGRDVDEISQVAHVEWRSDQPFEEVYEQFVVACGQTHQPARDIKFDVAFHELANSYEVMHRARTATSETARRPVGSLVLLVNEDWAITSEHQGPRRLEGLHADHGHDTTTITTVEATQNPTRPTGYDAQRWEEALYYARYFRAIEDGSSLLARTWFRPG